MLGVESSLVHSPSGNPEVLGQVCKWLWSLDYSVGMSVVYSAEETSKVRAGGTAHTRWISAIPRATPNGATLQEQKHHLYKSTTVLGMFGWNCTGFYSQKASIDARQSLTHEVWKHLTSPLPVPCSRYLLLAGGESCTCQKAYSVCSVF